MPFPNSSEFCSTPFWDAWIKYIYFVFWPLTCCHQLFSSFCPWDAMDMIAGRLLVTIDSYFMQFTWKLTRNSRPTHHFFEVNTITSYFYVALLCHAVCLSDVMYCNVPSLFPILLFLLHTRNDRMGNKLETLHSWTFSSWLETKICRIWVDAVTFSASGWYIILSGIHTRTRWFRLRVRFGFFCVFLCVSYLWPVCKFCVFFEFLVYFFLSVLCCQYQCNWLPGKTLSLNWPAMFHSLDRKVVTPSVSSVASLPYVR